MSDPSNTEPEDRERDLPSYEPPEVTVHSTRTVGDVTDELVIELASVAYDTPGELASLLTEIISACAGERLAADANVNVQVRTSDSVAQQVRAALTPNTPTPESASGLNADQKERAQP